MVENWRNLGVHVANVTPHMPAHDYGRALRWIGWALFILLALGIAAHADASPYHAKSHSHHSGIRIPKTKGGAHRHH